MQTTLHPSDVVFLCTLRHENYLQLHTQVKEILKPWGQISRENSFDSMGFILAYYQTSIWVHVKQAKKIPSLWHNFFSFCVIFPPFAPFCRQWLWGRWLCMKWKGYALWKTTTSRSSIRPHSNVGAMLPRWFTVKHPWVYKDVSSVRVSVRFDEGFTKVSSVFVWDLVPQHGVSPSPVTTPLITSFSPRVKPPKLTNPNNVPMTSHLSDKLPFNQGNIQVHTAHKQANVWRLPCML